MAPVERTEADVKGYIRIRDHAAFPSLTDTDLLLLNGPFTTVKTDGPHTLTLVPPSMIGPPEFVHIDMHDTDIPAIVSQRADASPATPDGVGACLRRRHCKQYNPADRPLPSAPARRGGSAPPGRRPPPGRSGRSAAIR